MTAKKQAPGAAERGIQREHRTRASVLGSEKLGFRGSGDRCQSFHSQKVAKHSHQTKTFFLRTRILGKNIRSKINEDIFFKEHTFLGKTKNCRSKINEDLIAFPRSPRQNSCQRPRAHLPPCPHCFNPLLLVVRANHNFRKILGQNVRTSASELKTPSPCPPRTNPSFP